jgi:hypothetical protein
MNGIPAWVRFRTISRSLESRRCWRLRDASPNFSLRPRRLDVPSRTAVVFVDRHVDVRLLGRSAPWISRSRSRCRGWCCRNRRRKRKQPVRPKNSTGRRSGSGWSSNRAAPATRAGTVEGDLLNLVIVGDRASIEEFLGAWDETESLTLGTAWKTARAFLLDSQCRYSRTVNHVRTHARREEV